MQSKGHAEQQGRGHEKQGAYKEAGQVADQSRDGGIQRSRTGCRARGMQSSRSDCRARGIQSSIAGDMQSRVHTRNQGRLQTRVEQVQQRNRAGCRPE